VTVRITAQESTKQQAAAAGWLFDHVIERGDRIAIIASSSPAYLAVTLGALRSGVIPVLIPPTLTSFEQDALIKDCDPMLVLREGELEQLAEWPGARRSELAPVPLARPMLYTSGTTGAPKGVYSGVLSESNGRALLMDESEQWGFDANDTNLIVSPLYHSAPMRFAMGTLMAGGSVVLPGPFDLPKLRAAIAQYRPTTAFMAPTHLQRLFADSDALPPLSSFRLLAHAGAPCPDHVRMDAARWFPKGSVWEFYGATEGQFSACSFDEWQERPGTVGKARRGRKLSIDKDTGAIWVKTPSHARFEYWQDAEKTAEAWRGDAFSVGDLGRLDKDGYLYLEGRRNDLIISGGVNVYPLEIERVLMAHPGVNSAAAYPVDSDDWGQKVCAVYVGDVPADELAKFAAERLAPHKLPKELRQVSEIPFSATGKLRRGTLAADLGLASPAPETSWAPPVAGTHLNTSLVPSDTSLVPLPASEATAITSMAPRSDQ
jgi:long-chain acyl-CoA synthetase